MTNQMLIVTNWAKSIDCGPLDVAPPNAPLLMPTQVLQNCEGVTSRAVAPLAALLNLFKHSLRRAG